MEIAPKIHRVEVPLGNRFVCVFLLVGSKGVLVLDTGMDDTPAAHIMPYLDKLSISPDQIRHVVNSHADIDHTGGNQALREMAPNAIFMCHELDRPMVEDLEWMINGRYGQFATDHNIADSEEAKTWMRENARHCPIDIGLTGGETIDLGDDWRINVLFTPGHSRGHITLYDANSRTALIADAALWNCIPTSDGQPAFPPTYRFIDTYTSTIHMLQSLPIDTLLTSHYPVYQGADVAKFLGESRSYVDRVERTLTTHLQNAKESFTLQELITSLNSKLGEWPEGAEILLNFPLAGHLERLVQHGKVTTARRDNLLTYKWSE